MVEEAEQAVPNYVSSHLPQSPLISKGYVVADKYELVAMIGQGGMGTVWLARHIHLERKVAVKFISIIHIESEEMLRRFDGEAKAVASLHSRHVVQVIDNGELEDGTPYMVMEYLEGESLHARIERQGAVSIDDAERIFRHVGMALSVAHDKGIIHRDIKPENIFLTISPEESDYVAKVLDFGVAKMTQARYASHARTRTGTIGGTPMFMSPEQVRGLKTVDHRADVYSMGALAFTMLTGSSVFDGKTFGELLFQICSEPLPKLTDRVPGLPVAVDTWFETSCARSPADRFQSVQEQVKAFSQALGKSGRASFSDDEIKLDDGRLSRSSPTTEKKPSEREAAPETDTEPKTPSLLAEANSSEPQERKSTLSSPAVEAPSVRKLSSPASQPSRFGMPLRIVAALLLIALVAAGSFFLGQRTGTQPKDSSTTPASS